MPEKRDYFSFRLWNYQLMIFGKCLLTDAQWQILTRSKGEAIDYPVIAYIHFLLAQIFQHVTGGNCSVSLCGAPPALQRCGMVHRNICIDREFEFYEFFSFVKYNEFYEFFSVEKIRKKFVIL